MGSPPNANTALNFTSRLRFPEHQRQTEPYSRFQPDLRRQGSD